MAPVPTSTLYFRPHEGKPCRHHVPSTLRPFSAEQVNSRARHRERAISSHPLPPISWLPDAFLAALLFRRLLRIQARLQGGAGFEARVLRGRDLDLLAGGRIAAFAGGALAHREGAEADQSDFVAFLERFGDAVEHGLERRRGADLRQFRLLGDVFDELEFIHLASPLPCATLPRRRPLIPRLAARRLHTCVSESTPGVNHSSPMCVGNARLAGARSPKNQGLSTIFAQLTKKKAAN